MNFFSENRRRFLKFMSGGTLGLGFSSLIPGALTLSACKRHSRDLIFKGIQPTSEDKLVLAPGLHYHIISRWGDPINQKGEIFGFNNDFTCFLPLARKYGPGEKQGLLWVNHESIIPEFIHHKKSSELSGSREEVLQEQKLVGGSIIHIKRAEGKWILRKNSEYNRRLHGRTPIPFSHNYKIFGSDKALGTLANCAGGLTPWNTFLSCEENFQHFYGDVFMDKGKRHLKIKNRTKFQWHKHFPLPPEHYGWVVEIDPFTGKSEKQILLGRFRHEGATPVVTRNGKTVVYMGEDRTDGFIYKFVSTGHHLKAGTLYAADTVKGRWLPLDIKKSQALKKTFQSQLEVLTYAHQSAGIVGATAQDRPEDIEIHKKTGEVFVTLTENPETNNKYGSILKIRESGDHDSLLFKASTWISGGMDSGLACPDNLCFDRKDNLWVTVDMKEKVMGTRDYKEFGNNGLFYIPMEGQEAGKPIQVASAPGDAEFTGPWFSPDYRTLFLSVQHPGISLKTSMNNHASIWPDGSGQIPRSAVVAIEGELLKKLI